MFGIRISNRPFGSKPSTVLDQNIQEITSAEHWTDTLRRIEFYQRGKVSFQTCKIYVGSILNLQFMQGFPFFRKIFSNREQPGKISRILEF